MTQDLIQEALEARANAHETSFPSLVDSPEAAAGLSLQQHRPRGRSAVRGWSAAAAAVLVALLAVVGFAVSDESDDLPVAGVGEPDTSGHAPSVGADSFTEVAARTHLEDFVAALDRQDFAAAAEMLGGSEIESSVAEDLNWTPDERPGEALARYCDQDLVFCGGLVVGEVAHMEDTVRAFLVVTWIPPGALGNGEPAAPGVEHSTPFRVQWDDGSMRVLDLPPRFDDVG